jgi:hypothetical protein
MQGLATANNEPVADIMAVLQDRSRAPASKIRFFESGMPEFLPDRPAIEVRHIAACDNMSY